jgi:hypothetical protein
MPVCRTGKVPMFLYNDCVAEFADARDGRIELPNRLAPIDQAEAGSYRAARAVEVGLPSTENKEEVL